MKPEQKETQLSVEKSIDIVRSFRNALIKTFLDDDSLKGFFLQKYNFQLSKVKLEFLKRELRELLISPVDLMHYSSVIKEIQYSNSASITKSNEVIFYQELESIFRKYNY